MLLYPYSIKVYEQFILSQWNYQSGHQKSAGKIYRWHLYKILTIFIGRIKIAGILIENSLFRDQLTTSYNCIGLNVNRKYSSSNAPNPVSSDRLRNDIKQENIINGNSGLNYWIFIKIIRPNLFIKEYLNNLYRRMVSPLCRNHCEHSFWCWDWGFYPTADWFYAYRQANRNHLFQKKFNLYYKNKEPENPTRFYKYD